MGKKSIKEAAAAGTSVFNQLASGNIQDAKDAQNVQDGKIGRASCRERVLFLV